MDLIDDVQKLQKAKVDLDIARTIALSAKSNLKRRTILLRSARRRNAPEEVKMVSADVYRVKDEMLIRHIIAWQQDPRKCCSVEDLCTWITLAC